MQFAFLWGVTYVALLVTLLAMSALASTGGAYAALIETIVFVLRILTEPSTVGTQIPATLSSPETLVQTMRAGLLSWQSLIVAVLIGLFVFVGSVAVAYTKALALGVIDNAVEGKKTTVVDMFRAGRKFWMPVLRYYTPFAKLLWLVLLIAIPLSIYMLGYLVATQGMQARLPAFFYLIVLLGAVFLLLRIATVFADAIILDGSRRPVRDSLRFSSSNVMQTIKIFGLLIIAAIIVFVVSEGANFIESKQLPVISVLAALFGIALYAFWRLWVSAFVVAVWRSGNLKRRMPRAS